MIQPFGHPLAEHNDGSMRRGWDDPRCAGSVATLSVRQSVVALNVVGGQGILRLVEAGAMTLWRLLETRRDSDRRFGGAFRTQPHHSNSSVSALAKDVM